MEELHMTKADLIDAIAASAGSSKKDAERALQVVLSTITEKLAAGEKISLIGFGTFEVRERKEKTCINPRTKEKLTAPACKAPVFKAGKALKDAVNK